jgi:4-hydroxy-tetrahydrodipicolinate synthase
MLKNAAYGGVNAAVLTAMRDDLSVDLDRTAAHCHWLLANGCNGLAVMGTTGEANSLGIDERIAMLEGLVARGVPGAKLLPGTGTTAITDTVLLTQKAREVGCRGALLLPPFYYKGPSDDGLLAYFSEVIERVGGGISFYLYNFPQQSAIPFSVDFFARLLKKYPTAFKGVKDSSGNFENGKSYVEAFARDGFEVYAGDDTLLLPLLRLGSAGCITAAGNMNSAVAAKVCANWDNAVGEAETAILGATRRAAVSVPLIPGLKALKARQTCDAGWTSIRPPHLKLTAEQQAKLFAAWDASGITLAKAA